MTTLVNFHDVKEHWDRATQTWDDPKYVYIGRAERFNYRLPRSKWANPFNIHQYGRKEAIDLYRRKLVYTPGQPLLSQIGELRDKVLVCWCSPEPCHGDVLLTLLGEGKASEETS